MKIIKEGKSKEEHGTTYCVCPNCGKNAFKVEKGQMCETCRYYNNNTYWCSRYNDTTYHPNCSSYQVKEEGKINDD